MADLSDIRKGIRRRLETIAELSAMDYVPGAFVPPIAIVGFPSRIDYDHAMGRGIDEYTIPIKVIVAVGDQESADDALEAYLAKTGSSSVKAAFNIGPGAQTLGGVVSDCRVTAMTGAGGQEFGAVTYLVADFELMVIV